MRLSQISEDMSSIFNDVKNDIFNSLRVATYAEVLAVRENGRVDVRPLVKEHIELPKFWDELQKSFVDKKEIELPPLKNIRCSYTASIGDKVVLIHFDRNPDRAGMGSDGNRHALNDCIAMPVDTSYTYSTEEQMTTKKWIDGKRIYSRTFILLNSAIISSGIALGSAAELLPGASFITRTVAVAKHSSFYGQENLCFYVTNADGQLRVYGSAITASAVETRWITVEYVK